MATNRILRTLNLSYLPGGRAVAAPRAGGRSARLNNTLTGFITTANGQGAYRLNAYSAQMSGEV
jgi:hypothetical protein